MRAVVRPNIKLDDLDLLKVLQTQRNNAMVAASKQKDHLPVNVDGKFLIGLYVFNALAVVAFLIGAKIWGWW